MKELTASILVMVVGSGTIIGSQAVHSIIGVIAGCAIILVGLAAFLAVRT